MAETIRSLEELGGTAGEQAPEAAERAPREPVRDALNRSYATGKRKESVARVWVRPGKGVVTVTGAAGVRRPWSRAIGRRRWARAGKSHRRRP